MRKNQNGFGLIEVILISLFIIFIGFVGWYTMVRPTWESRKQLTQVINQLKVPSSYEVTGTSFKQENPGLTTVFSTTRTYKITIPTTRTEALVQIVKSLGLSPADHQTVNIYDEQLNGVSSPLFPFPGNGSIFKFSARLEPSYSGMPFLEQCSNNGTDYEYRACVNNDSRWGKNALVESVEITVWKEPS
jgi:hypothetical protein